LLYKHKALLAITRVCALHEHERTLVVSSWKSLKIQIFFKERTISVIFPEGASPLHAGVTPGSVSKPQGGLSRGMHWRKRDYKIRYWRTGTAYEAGRWG